MSSERILIVEDDRLTLRVLSSKFREAGYQVVAAASAPDAISAVREQPPDLMVLDLTLLDEDPFNTLSDGFACLHWLRRSFPEAEFPVIIHTADQSENLEARALEHGVSAVFRKGEDLDALMETVRLVLDGWQAAQSA